MEEERCFFTGEDRGKDGSKQPPKVQQEQPKESLEAELEGLHNLLGKAEELKEELDVIPPSEPKVLLLPNLSH